LLIDHDRGIDFFAGMPAMLHVFLHCGLFSKPSRAAVCATRTHA
jgi:hypothetical protein